MSFSPTIFYLIVHLMSTLINLFQVGKKTCGEKKKKKVEEQRLYVVTLSVTPTYFSFHVRFFARIPRTDMHRYTITSSWVFLSLSFIIVNIHIHIQYKLRALLTHIHTYVHIQTQSHLLYSRARIRRNTHTPPFLLFHVLIVYNFYQRTVIMAHNKEWIRISSTFPSFSYLSH